MSMASSSYRAVARAAHAAQWLQLRQAPRTRHAMRPPPFHSARTFCASPAHLSKPFSFDDMNDLSSSPRPNTILIDAREPSEYADGHIPGAINIPVKSSPDALHLPEEEFEDRFGFSKPKINADTVFYCKAGVRSRAAAQIAEQAGYKNVGDYPGSWIDWMEKGGKVER